MKQLEFCLDLLAAGIVMYLGLRMSGLLDIIVDYINNDK